MLEPERILLADDEEKFTRTTAALLCDEGYECDCAADGPTAMRLLSQGGYHLLISDIKMPGNTELELIRELSRVAVGLPVILVTGYPALETAIASVQLAVVSYLRKPVDFDELLTHIERALQGSRVHRRIRQSCERTNRLHDELTGILAAVRPSQNSPSAVRSFLECTARNLLDATADLVHISALLQASDKDEWADILPAAEAERLAAAIDDAVQVLKETKGSFKSKQLADLRRRLEALLEENRGNGRRPT